MGNTRSVEGKKRDSERDMDQGRLRAGVRWAERAPERQIMRQTERERVSLALCVVEVLDRFSWVLLHIQM